MSDETREAQATATENPAKQAGEAADENQKLAEPEEQITKPAPKAKPQREKDPKKVAAGKKLAEKNRQAKAALEREVKREREIAERERENENSAGWLPEMSFQTVLSIVGIAFTAFELYHRFRQKDSSAGGSVVIGESAVKGPVSSREEPKHSEAQSGAGRSGAPTSGAPTSVAGRSEAKRSKEKWGGAERSPKFGMV